MTDVKEEEHLLLRILPEQVSQLWDKFAPLIEKSLPPTVTNRRQRMANVLRSILMDDLVVWVYFNSEGRERYVTTTLVRTDKVTLGKDLLIYSFTSLGQITPEQAMNGVEVLKKYARGNDCKSIIAYSADERVVEFLESKGASANYKLIQMEV